MSDDILEIPEFLRNLDDGPKVKRVWVNPVIEKRETKRDDGTTLIRHITVEEGYYMVDGIRDVHRHPPPPHVVSIRCARAPPRRRGAVVASCARDTCPRRSSSRSGPA